jgi:hypothetical protein
LLQDTAYQYHPNGQLGSVIQTVSKHPKGVYPFGDLLF